LHVVAIEKSHTRTSRRSFVLGSKQLARVVVVGRVHKRADSTSNLQFLLEDGTGSIDVHLYVDAEAEPMDDLKSKITVGSYVKVVGQLRSFANKRSIKANAVLPIDDYNEVTHHLMSCIYAHLYLKNKKTTKFGGASTTGAPSLGAGVGSTSYGAAGTSYQANGGDAGGASVTSGSNADRVLNAIRQAREEMGMSVSQVMQLTSLSENDVRQAIEQVAADGHVYSTVDDDHFKTCD